MISPGVSAPQCFEQIQKVVIPLSDIDRYLHAVGRFQCLTEVIFKMDEFLVICKAFGFEGPLPLDDITPENETTVGIGSRSFEGSKRRTSAQLILLMWHVE